MHHVWSSSFSRKFPAWSPRVPSKIHTSLETFLHGKTEIVTQDIWKLDLSRKLYCTLLLTEKNIINRKYEYDLLPKNDH